GLGPGFGLARLGLGGGRAARGRGPDVGFGELLLQTLLQALATALPTPAQLTILLAHGSPPIRSAALPPTKEPPGSGRTGVYRNSPAPAHPRDRPGSPPGNLPRSPSKVPGTLATAPPEKVPGTCVPEKVPGT